MLFNVHVRPKYWKTNKGREVCRELNASIKSTFCVGMDLQVIIYSFFFFFTNNYLLCIIINPTCLIFLSSKKFDIVLLLSKNNTYMPNSPFLTCSLKGCLKFDFYALKWFQKKQMSIKKNQKI